MSFLTEDFLLNGKTARDLYHSVASELPIIDYHCHLNPAEIASDKRFSSITELWLGGDHYKWRLERLAGIDERLITGNASDIEKFRAYAQTIETAIGNPLYHWSHLEMKKYFGITDHLTVQNADPLFAAMNESVGSPDFSAKKLIQKSNVRIICTTDDPSDDLRYHMDIAENPVENCRVLPTFRPDKAVVIEKEIFPDYIQKLSSVSGITIRSVDDVVKALELRAEFFASVGGKLSDHDFGKLPEHIGTHAQAEIAFQKRMNGMQLSDYEADSYKSFVLVSLAAVFCRLGWTMQLHIGAMRNNSTRMFHAIGPDTGYDTMSDLNTAKSLSLLLNTLDSQGILPRTILYTLNPKDYYPMAALCGCFTEPGIKAKTQFGAAWWFIDHRDGMENQMKTLADMNLLSAFVGMLTDSRSFISYPRHEYFRRIFCNLIGGWVDNGEFPKDKALLERIVKGVCYENALNYFAF